MTDSSGKKSCKNALVEAS